MSSENNENLDTNGILMGRLVLSVVATAGGSHVEIDESGMTGMTPMDMLGLLEMAKVSVYEGVITSQYLDEDPDVESQDGPDE